ncbi:TlpA family protein disulfide reductase [Mucilaginibacter roseus]|uniref:TlpA family protein disulfide reductase n=1 Tax=Mucilaginibacter roseus TaxID=1528868 RepID=A0ABS8TVZ5_9SPHI|nr:TlpA disulfide reductase family protein [Mucilaginibacter roseus]MCD8739063.1 TlpA family protein disulfide reductase [Mucilaginibacter roseus]
MKKTILYRVLAALCLFSSASAQDNTTIPPLKTGDTLPALTFTRLVNSQARTIRTTDYKDQLLIIDFWATWCSSCIKMFPAVEELQQKFQGKVKFLAVNAWHGDSKEKLSAFFVRHPEFHFPSVWGDTVLSRLLPHQTVPFYAWIRNNQLLATTGTEAIDADTIAAVLAGTFRPGDQENRPLNLNRPLYLGGNGGEPARYIYRSLLTPYSPGYRNPVMRSTNDQGQTDRLLFVNHTAYALIRSAFPALGRVNENRIMTAKDVGPGFLQDSSSYQWRARHRFTYEAIFPPRSRAEALRLMQEDIRRYFGLTVDSIVTERECLVFKTTQETPSNHTDLPNRKPETNWYTPESNIPVILAHYPLSEALQLFDEVSELPVLNETGFDPVIDLRLKKAAVEEPELLAALKKYGVTLSHEKRKIRMYVIHQVNESITPTP